MIQIDPKGNVITTDLGLETTHEITATTKSLVTLTNNVLTIKGIPVTLPYGRYSAPQIFYLNNIVYVSVTDVEAQKVYLYYSDGKAVSGFPVYGVSAIDLNNADKDKALEFVVQGESLTFSSPMASFFGFSKMHCYHWVVKIASSIATNWSWPVTTKCKIIQLSERLIFVQFFSATTMYFPCQCILL